MSDEEIADYMSHMGFELKNPRNWTYATPDIYLSDMHDENVIRSKKSKKHNVPVTLCSETLSFMDSKRVLFLNSFLKKSTKQYKGEIEIARKILENYI